MIEVQPVAWLDKVMLKRFRGMARVRNLLKMGQPAVLARILTNEGVTLALNPEDYVDSFVLKYGYYERDVLDAILSNLPADGVLWDVGANFGLHSLTVKKLRSDAGVIAFEPVPFTAARLIQNAKTSRLDVKVCSVALGSSGGYAEIAIKLAGNSGISSLAPWAGVVYDTSCICRVESGDKLVELGTIPAPAVIKIDVEGFEFQVLQGITNLLGSPGLRAIIFESDGAQLEDITGFLESFGFSVCPIRPRNTAESEHISPNNIAIRMT